MEEIRGDAHRVTAIDETLEKQPQFLGTETPSSTSNVHAPHDLDGHIVQGHVDTTATCTHIKVHDGSWLFRFEFPKKFSHLVIEKGSICLNGTSLTIFNVKKTALTSPSSLIRSNIPTSKPSPRVPPSTVDMIGKYVSRLMTTQHSSSLWCPSVALVILMEYRFLPGKIPSLPPGHNI